MKSKTPETIIVDEASDLTKQVKKFYKLFSEFSDETLSIVNVAHFEQKTFYDGDILRPEEYIVFFPDLDDGFKIRLTSSTRIEYRNVFHKFLDFWFDIDYSFRKIKFGAEIYYLGNEVKGLYNKLCILEKAYAQKEAEIIALEERIKSKIAEFVPAAGEAIS